MRLTDLSEDQVKTRTKLKQMPFLVDAGGQHNYTPFEAFLVRLTYEITRKGHGLKDAADHVKTASSRLAAAWSKIEAGSEDFFYLKARAKPATASFAGDCLFGVMRVFDREAGYASGSIAYCYFVGTAAEIFSSAQKAILAPYSDRNVALGELRLESLIVVNATTAWRYVRGEAQARENKDEQILQIDLTDVFGEGRS